MALEIETATFQKLLPALLAEPANVGRFALVHAEEYAGNFGTVDEALNAGYDRFGLETFLVKPIVEREEPRFFPRAIKPCQS